MRPIAGSPAGDTRAIEWTPEEDRADGERAILPQVAEEDNFDTKRLVNASSDVRAGGSQGGALNRNTISCEITPSATPSVAQVSWEEVDVSPWSALTLVKT